MKITRRAGMARWRRPARCSLEPYRLRGDSRSWRGIDFDESANQFIAIDWLGYFIKINISSPNNTYVDTFTMYIITLTVVE